MPWSSGKAPERLDQPFCRTWRDRAISLCISTAVAYDGYRNEAPHWREGDLMPIAVYLHPPNLTLEQFDQVDRRVQEAIGGGGPKGNIHHSVFGTDGQLMIYDIWESEADFEAFGKVLMPIVAEMGLDAGEPAVMPVHRLQEGRS
jgi:heme-degrading monooxygenase HmoA